MSHPGDPVTATYYPELANIINNDPTAIERLELDCLMCKDKMTNPEDRTCGAFILPCGHMFCPSCVKNLRTHNQTKRNPHRCPVCRFDLRRKICGCPIDNGTLFKPTQQQDENLLANLQEEVSSLRGCCVTCHLNTLIRGLRQIALYLHDPSQMIKDGHFLRISVEKRDTKLRFETDYKNEEVKRLPVSSDLLELFAMAGNSFYAANNGSPVPDGSSVYKFELTLCKRCPENQRDRYRYRRREMEYVEKKLQAPGCDRLALAREVAVKVAKSFTSDEAFKEHMAETKKLRFEELALVEAVELNEHHQDHESSRLYALAAIPVAVGLLAGGIQLGTKKWGL
ncbi:uncharacterized protein BKA55DRAFT_676283 [Fusarium redolens]|uniref:RING-type domain-containing protein n=1 Tax=Fusarium redolens TaxID=48865 RepID=A0A9P9H2H2_FUSRE|nr:uncharacterized protein BKA55DRAFT_676283 [Fusarium redolens]KAH7248662.1 hypothetical protein BKA55DRAFT_676283 [Fusarium redolens]